MKTHFAEEDDVAICAHDTADDHCWRDHRVGSYHLLGEIEVLLLVLIAVVVLSVTSINWATHEASTSVSLYPATQPVPVYFAQGPMTRRQQVTYNQD